jgi:predicted amidophosphoribosyltransferase
MSGVWQEGPDLACGWYADIRDQIQAFKAGDPATVQRLAEGVAAVLLDWKDSLADSVLVPLPPSVAYRLCPTYPGSRLVALVSGWCGLADGSHVLRRHTSVPPRSRDVQVHLASLEVSEAEKVHGRPVVWFDDVPTTGATAQAGRQLLRAAGASPI